MESEVDRCVLISTINKGYEQNNLDNHMKMTKKILRMNIGSFEGVFYVDLYFRLV